MHGMAVFSGRYTEEKLTYFRKSEELLARNKELSHCVKGIIIYYLTEKNVLHYVMKTEIRGKFLT